MKAQKKGFTLIELMVVIVIIGILAAIAIPKLFGMSAKAKAQEVPGAAGTYTKLQTAYIVETSKLGGNKRIAYLFPGQTTYAATGNITGFTYAVGLTTEAESTSGSVAWTAAAKNALNDCPAAAANWTAVVSIDAIVTATVADACKSLTPNFESLK
jgi:prepilin-type N-terminal cleavage/methylation domain-containing protein